ncbi:MAG: alpha-ketoacid dehydrogenase subunit beta [Desulfobacterales bacterium]|nr:alpha-ketoacid dehydrogenase subunit beta [Desulfobacterales bacterium]
MNSLIDKFSGSVLSYREALFHAMDDALSGNPKVIIMGQGVTDHKGLFGTTLNFSSKYGRDRVLDTPLAEEALAGIALGASLNGLYPINTHMRVDFSLCCMNQVVNLIAKYKYMSGGQFECPMLIRMVIGRSWGQGAQHSQSLQSFFAHVPGLTVIMPSHSDSILKDYHYIVHSYRAPVISIEHRLLYDVKFNIEQNSVYSNDDPLSSHLVRNGNDVTIVATSIMVLEALRAAQYLSTNAGLECEVIDLNCVSHPDKEMIMNSVEKTGRLIIADTSWQAYGVCAEVCRIVCEKAPSLLKVPVLTLGMQPATCPTAKTLEDYFYPNLQTLTGAIARIVSGKTNHGIPLPDEHSMADAYKKFRGPF